MHVPSSCKHVLHQNKNDLFLLSPYSFHSRFPLLTLYNRTTQVTKYSKET